MKLHYTVTNEAYFDFNIYHFENSASTRKQIRKTRILPPVTWSITAFTFCGYFFYTQQTIPFALPAALLVVSVLWYVFYPACFRKSLEKKLKRWMAQGVGKEFIGDFTLELLEDRIRTTDGISVMETLYGNVERLVENKGCLYIYTGVASALILPLEAFSGEDSFREFRNDLEEKARTAPKTQAPN